MSGHTALRSVLVPIAAFFLAIFIMILPIPPIFLVITILILASGNMIAFAIYFCIVYVGCCILLASGFFDGDASSNTGTYDIPTYWH